MESKEEAKKRGVKSPDRVDSLALTFAYPVSCGTGKVFREYNPLENYR